MSFKQEWEVAPATPVTASTILTDIESGKPHVRAPSWLPPLLCEMFGIMTMVIVGLGSNLQAFLLDPQTNGVAYAFGWGVGLMLALLITIDVSGGHLNPAITISQALFRGFEWKLVLPYIFFQILGSFLGAVIVQGIFYGFLDKMEGGNFRTAKTVGNFVITVPEFQSNAQAFFTQFVGAAMLLIGVAVVTHNRFKTKTWVKAFIMHWTMTGVSGCMGVSPAFALNPARDLGPRIMCAAFGYSPSLLWTSRNGFFFWGCMAAPVAAAIVVTFLHDLLIGGGVKFTVQRIRRRKST